MPDITANDDLEAVEDFRRRLQEWLPDNMPRATRGGHQVGRADTPTGSVPEHKRRPGARSAVQMHPRRPVGRLEL